MKFVKWAAILAGVLLVLSVLKNGIVQAAIEGGLKSAMRVPAHIGSTNLSFLGATLELKNLKIGNPPGYPDKNLADIPLIFVKLDPSDLSKGKFHFKELRLNLKEITVVKNKDGRLNVNELKPAAGQKKEGDAKAPDVRIDHLYLTVDKVVYKDYSAGGAPQIQTFEVQMKDREYHNIQNPSVLASLIMFEALTRTGLSRLAGLDLGFFKSTASDALSEGLGLAKGGVEEAKNVAKNLLSMFN